MWPGLPAPAPGTFRLPPGDPLPVLDTEHRREEHAFVPGELHQRSGVPDLNSGIVGACVEAEYAEAGQVGDHDTDPGDQFAGLRRVQGREPGPFQRLRRHLGLIGGVRCVRAEAGAVAELFVLGIAAPLAAAFRPHLIPLGDHLVAGRDGDTDLRFRGDDLVFALPVADLPAVQASDSLSLRAGLCREPERVQPGGPHFPVSGLDLLPDTETADLLAPALNVQ